MSTRKYKALMEIVLAMELYDCQRWRLGPEDNFKSIVTLIHDWLDDDEGRQVRTFKHANILFIVRVR